MRLSFIIILCISFFQSSLGILFAADSEKEYKLIFSSFDNKSAQKYAYLRDSIQTMLMSRLASDDNVEVIDRVLSKEQLAALAQRNSEAKSLPEEGADYLVTGSIYALAKGVNVQVTMYPFDTTKEVLTFSKISEQPENIISDSDTLISEILQKLFGKRNVEGLGDVPTDTTASGFTTEHPEVEYKKGLYSGTIVESDLHGIEAKASGIKKTLSVSGEVIACTVGDLDGDGTDELISLTSSTVNIYQSRDRQIVAVDEMKLPSGLRGHGLTVADLNADGMLEIYISATNELRVASRIVAWSKTAGFTTLAKEIGWYIRPMEDSKGNLILAGQKRGRSKVDFVGKGVYQLELGKNFDVTEKGLLPIPDGVDLFEFTYAELDGKKGAELVVLDGEQKLRVFSNDNELLWVSSDTYGGSKTYIGPSQGAAVDEQSKTGLSVDEDADRELKFVPARILVTDVDNDGLSEVVVNKSKSGILGFFKKIRSYDGGTVVGLAWNGSELTEAWRTGRYKGYIVDYFFQKTDGVQSAQTDSTNTYTGSGRLYVANMPYSGSLVGLLPGVSDTKLTNYELDFYKKKQSDNK
jgi:TolB-like protein